jgi:ABC-type Fe3+-siderophore transport system permease subunit
MWRERTLKIVLVTESLWHQNQSMYVFDMMLSLYVALGVFLLMAARNPSANRSLIAFTAWSGFAHAAVMAVTAFSKGGYRGDLWGVAVLVIIGVALIVLAPAKQSGNRVSPATV